VLALQDIVLQGSWRVISLIDVACTEIVYIDAPHPASGQIPRDVKPFFGDGPYFEWFTVSELGDQFGEWGLKNRND